MCISITINYISLTFLAAMSKGAATKCKARDVELTADDAGKVLTASGFPFTGVRQVKDAIVKRAGLKSPDPTINPFNSHFFPSSKRN